MEACERYAPAVTPVGLSTLPCKPLHGLESWLVAVRGRDGVYFSSAATEGRSHPRTSLLNSVRMRARCL